MASAIGSILRAATRGQGRPLNIITFPTHEAYETSLCLTGHNFYAIRANGIKDWNRKYRPLPANYTLLNPARGNNQLPPELDFDLVLSQNKFGQFQIAQKISRQLHLPLISLEHTLPHPSWGAAQRQGLRQMSGHIDVFISDFSRQAWGFEGAADVIHHGIDTETFKPNAMTVKKKGHVLSVVNDFVNRDWCCGFKLWEEVTKDLPFQLLGDTPGMSKPAASVAELVREYRKAAVFLNTSLISPVPTALLEAMSCGCAVVSSATCMIPDIIEDGVNGYLSNDPAVLRERVQALLEKPDLAQRLGVAARKTIEEKFSLASFINNWNATFQKAANLTFTGA